MIRFLQSIVELLFEALEGIIGFLEEFIPLFLKTLFAISPFCLLVCVSFVLRGRTAGIVTSVIVLVFIVIGFVWAKKNNVSVSGPSLKVSVYVIVVDVLMLIIIASRLGWVDWPNWFQGNNERAVQKQDIPKKEVFSYKPGFPAKIWVENLQINEHTTLSLACKATNDDYWCYLLKSGGGLSHG